MNLYEVLVWILVSVGVLLTFICSLGVLLMDDPLQRLHFIAPPSTLSASCIALAVCLDSGSVQAGGKAAAVTLLLMAMNAVVTHATARAARIRACGRWETDGRDKVP